MEQSKKPPMRPMKGRDIYYVELGVEMPAKVVFVDKADPMTVHLMCWTEMGEQKYRRDVHFGVVGMDRVWYWPVQQHFNIDMLKGQGEEFRKQMLEQAKKLVDEGKMSAEQYAGLQKRLAPSPNPPSDKGPTQ